MEENANLSSGLGREGVGGARWDGSIGWQGKLSKIPGSGLQKLNWGADPEAWACERTKLEESTILAELPTSRAAELGMRMSRPYK